MLTTLKTFGSSMEPFFKDGDVLILEKINFKKIRVNDLITFKKNGLFNFRDSENQGSAKQVLITHRVIYKASHNYFITKGDNNLSDDGKVYPNQIIGKVFKVTRGKNTFDPNQLYLFQSTFYFQQIDLICQKLTLKGINFVIIKGLPIHLFFEGEHPKRIYADCDILIDKKDFQKTARLLASLGYTSEDTSLSKTHQNLKNKISEVSFFKSINHFRIVFDVHLEAAFLMTQLGKLDSLYSQKLLEEFSQSLLDEKRQVKLNNRSFPILSLDNLIIYLSLHLFHHNFRGYNRYGILDKVLRLKNKNLEKIAEKINQYQLGNFVYPVMLLLKKHYQTPLSKTFLKAIKPKNNQTLEFINKNILKENIFEDELRIGSGVKRFKYIFYLSPNPLFKKLLIFVNPQVLYSIFWVLKRKLFTRFG